MCADPEAKKGAEVPGATGAGQALDLWEMAAGDLEVAARLEGEPFGAETWSRDLLTAELVVSHGPMADRHYVVVESEESGGDGDTYDATDCAAGTGSHKSRLLGYAGLYHAGRLASADLPAIVTIPAAHGRGIISLILAELVSTAREMSCLDALLEVCQPSEAAQWLYARHGFVPTGWRHRYCRTPPEGAMVMRLTLRPCPGPVGVEAGDPSEV